MHIYDCDTYPSCELDYMIKKIIQKLKEFVNFYILFSQKMKLLP